MITFANVFQAIAPHETSRIKLEFTSSLPDRMNSYHLKKSISHFAHACIEMYRYSAHERELVSKVRITVKRAATRLRCILRAI